MKKIILTLFFILIFFIVFNSNNITSSIILSFNICFNNLFPTLIPFMLLSNIIIKYDFVNELSEMFSFFTNKVFKLNKSCAFALIMSMISGTPSNGKYLKDLYDNKLITINDIRKCLNFCHFTNPIFIIGTIGLTFLNNKKMGLVILISHYMSAIIIGILFRKQTLEINNTIKKKNEVNHKFISILNKSIIDTANTLLLILGIITFCLMITTSINTLFNINNNYKFVYGFLEITQGLKYLSLSNFDIYVKTIIASFIISFGGFCIHMQVFSILDNKKIRYLPYFLYRLLHAIISAFITTIILYC